MGTNVIDQRKSDFLDNLDLSKSTTINYVFALNSNFLKEILKKECQGKQLFEITKLEELWKLYTIINIHPKNISSHRIYSCVIMKYIKYLNGGKKYGRRIDYKGNNSNK